jgi:signal transduction histidine kinase
MPRLGLRTRFFLYSNTVIVLTVGMIMLVAIRRERSMRYDAIHDRGTTLAMALATPVTDALLYQELGIVEESGLIDDYISEMLDANRDLMQYAIVADPDGKVEYSNRWELLGRRFSRALGRSAAATPPTTSLVVTQDGDETLEIRVPLSISSKFWGSLTVGVSLETVRADVEGVVERLAVFAAVLVLANSLVTALYVETLIRPILALHRVMTRAGAGDLTVRASQRGSDEVAELSARFNGMMNQLEEAKQREAAHQLRLMHAEKMAAIGTLAAGEAHEVNNPLGGILTCIENLRADPDNAAMRGRYLGLMEDGLRRIGRTVTNLLDFSRPREMHREPTSVNHTLRHVAELAEYQLEKRDIALRFELDPGEPVAIVDHFQMEQLLLNLVLNAVQAMPNGGTLTLASRRRGDRIHADVRDTGVGIPASMRDRIFDPFYTTRAVGEGTGLGLAVSLSIAVGHGGTIEVESSVGKGSLFRVVLPVLPYEPGSREA